MSSVTTMNTNTQSNAEAVREFTEGSCGKSCPATPQLMSRDTVKFLLRMLFSELDELACTVTSNAEERDAFMHEALESRDQCNKYRGSDNTISDDSELRLQVIGEQGDALVDAWYYSLNVAAGAGINLSGIFDVVHAANMAKRDPVTKQFQRRADGKVIKPVGWKEPNITEEIQRQTTEGSWLQV